MPFIPQVYTDFGAALGALEQRIAAALAEQSSAPVIKTARVALPELQTGTGNWVTVTWPEPFADANYTISALVEDDVQTDMWAGVARRVSARTAEAVTFQVDTSTYMAAGSGLLHVVAVHD